MKILHISTTDQGGAAKACIRLHLALLDGGVQSKGLFLNTSQIRVPETYKFIPKPPPVVVPSRSVLLKRKAKRILKEFYLYKEPRPVKPPDYLANKPDGYYPFSVACSPYDITQDERYAWADIVHLHWVSGFLDYKTFFSSGTPKPVVWTLHDMNPFTGGCHHSHACEGYTQQCLNCPQLQGTIDPDYSATQLRIKADALRSFRSLTIVTPSRWLGCRAKESIPFKNIPRVCIPNGADEYTFQPQDKYFCRQLLGLPQDKKILLFVSHSVTFKLKGYQLLLDALSEVKDLDGLELCAIGERTGRQEGVYELGTIYDERLMSAAYSAADVFVLPSLAENLPNVIIESLMCGTPVIAFPVGGIPEMIENGSNGMLSDEISATGLARTIRAFFRQVDSFDPSAISADARKRFSMQAQKEAYNVLYKQMLNLRKQ